MFYHWFQQSGLFQAYNDIIYSWTPSPCSRGNHLTLKIQLRNGRMSKLLTLTGVSGMLSKGRKKTPCVFFPLPFPLFKFSISIICRTRYYTSYPALDRWYPSLPFLSPSYAQLQGISTAGGLDESPEELRVKAVQAIVAGNVNEYVSRLASWSNRVLTHPFLQLAYEANRIRGTFTYQLRWELNWHLSPRTHVPILPKRMTKQSSRATCPPYLRAKTGLLLRRRLRQHLADVSCW